MKDLRRENLRQLFLDFIDTQPDDEWDDTDAWKRYLETYDDLLAEVKRLRKYANYLEYRIYGNHLEDMSWEDLRFREYEDDLANEDYKSWLENKNGDEEE